MENSPSSRPLVTFALFAYNQEEYVREAIEGAFAQTYEPLEIILSDDCSSDRTYEVMQEMAAAYTGRHSVRVSQNEQNMGVTPHVWKILSQAKGAYFVLAAGDDVSKSYRVKRITECFLSTNACGISSAFDRIDEFGNLTSKNATAAGDKFIRNWFSLDREKFVHGATSAYARRILKYIDQVPDVHAEDGVMTIAIHANKDHVSFISEALLCYRSNPKSQSNSSGGSFDYNSILALEKKLIRSNYSYLNLCIFAKETVNRSIISEDQKKEIINRVEVSEKRFRQRQLAYSKRFISRVKSIFIIRSIKDMLLSFSRLFGINVFSFVKSIIYK